MRTLWTWLVLVNAAVIGAAIALVTVVAGAIAGAGALALERIVRSGVDFASPNPEHEEAL